MNLRTFSGGVHTCDHKRATESKSIKEGPMPSEIILPLQQNAGAVCEALVESGDHVKVGGKVGDSDALIAAPIHSPVSGVVKAIEPRMHCTGLKLMSIVIKPDLEQAQIELDEGLKNPTPAEVQKIVREAGIVGLGGAAFPTQVKMTPPKGVKIDSVIVNGCECEPYLTVDYRLMVEEPQRVIDGLELILKTVGGTSGYIGIEANKPEAIEILSKLTERNPKIEVICLETKYPQGAEKQLIKSILGREVAPKALPSSVGVLVQNVATTIAVFNAVTEGMPLIKKVVTVSGAGIEDPQNLRVMIGTPINDVIEACGGLHEGAAKIIIGGPMMGMALSTLSAPVVKATSGIVAITEEEIGAGDIRPCIKCARCVESCPMGLMPNRLGALAELGLLDELQEANIFDCVECGVCSFMCPSRRPLVQYIKLGKYLLAMEKEKKAS